MIKGMVHVYTGDGKGKSTAAIGLAIRAIGHNMKVCYSYFHKQPEKYGYPEIQILKQLGSQIHGFAPKHPFCDKNTTEKEISEQCRNGIIFLTNLVLNQNFDILILDEILISIRDKFLKEKDLINFIKNKPEKLELILTGRTATEKIIKLANYVSEIKNIKHPFDQNILGRIGIEY